MNSEKEFKEMNKVIDANQTMKTKKVQGFLPRELLLFLGLDHQFIEDYLETQRVSHPSATFPVNKMESIVTEDVYEEENFKE